jgi:hypothetical protein
MNKIIFISAVLAATTLLAAGLVVFPDSVQEAQANPCSIQANGPGGVDTSGAVDADLNCDFEGIGILIINDYSNDNDNVPLGELPLPLPSE